ncbi:VanW family protein [Sulfobacillus thermosulfidooxidans]|uniref:VanW family protein n=1 Tax=Sulfobacillus thermosulfidooxidans TaxID=28034 RepID=UPI00040CFFD5|nr:VanW family protein [Sulfobacillus thermosulfidooxidans]
MMRQWLVMTLLGFFSPLLSPHASVSARHVTLSEYHQPAPIVLISSSPSAGEGAQALKLPYVLGQQTTNYFHASPSQAKNIELAARRLDGTVVKPGHIFSYYAVVGPYTEENGYGWGRAFVGDRIVPSVGGGVCQGSSTLYSALLRTGLPIVERHNHGLTVPYLPPGEDATVASDYLNFQFRNNRSTPILITAQAKDRHMTVKIWGASPGPDIVVRHKILQTYPFKTIVRYSASLKPGEQKVLAPGQPGVRVQNWLEIKGKNGTEIKQLGIDRYRPSPRIIEKGLTSSHNS